MKTAGRGTPNCWTRGSDNRAHGAEDQNTPCLHKWAAKQEKLQPLKWCFFLTPPFRELTRQVELLPRCPSSDFNRGLDPTYSAANATRLSVTEIHLALEACAVLQGTPLGSCLGKSSNLRYRAIMFRPQSAGRRARLISGYCTRPLPAKLPRPCCQFEAPK
jgi:hypothetical protein